MSKPSDLPVWATDASYPAGADPWAETDTKTEPSGGKQAEGFEPRERPPAQYLNWWMNLAYLWLAWLDALVIETQYKNVLPVPTKATNWAYQGDLSATPYVSYKSSGAGDLDINLSNWMEFGRTLKNVHVGLVGDNAVDVVGTVYTHQYGGGTSTAAATDTATNVNSAGDSLEINGIDTLLTHDTGALDTNAIWLRINANAANAEVLSIILEFETVA
jgi:hypothetical protein